MFDNSAWRKPSEMGGSTDSVKITDLEGHLLVVVSNGDEITVETTRGPSEARPVRIIDVDDPSGDWLEAIIFQKALRGQVSRAAAAGSPLVGRLGRGEPAPGKSAPWLIIDPSDTEMERARTAYFRVSAGF